MDPSIGFLLVLAVVQESHLSRYIDLIPRHVYLYPQQHLERFLIRTSGGCRRCAHSIVSSYSYQIIVLPRQYHIHPSWVLC